MAGDDHVSIALEDDLDSFVGVEVHSIGLALSEPNRFHAFAAEFGLGQITLREATAVNESWAKDGFGELAVDETGVGESAIVQDDAGEVSIDEVAEVGTLLRGDEFAQLTGVHRFDGLDFVGAGDDAFFTVFPDDFFCCDHWS